MKEMRCVHINIYRAPSKYIYCYEHIDFQRSKVAERSSNFIERLKMAFSMINYSIFFKL